MQGAPTHVPTLETVSPFISPSFPSVFLPVACLEPWISPSIQLQEGTELHDSLTRENKPPRSLSRPGASGKAVGVKQTSLVRTTVLNL